MWPAIPAALHPAPTGGSTTTPANPGSILEFTYQIPPGKKYNNNLITEDVKDRSIDVYPNPANTFIIVYNYKDPIGRTIELFDLNGRIVNRTRVNSMATRIETNRLANGLYILKVSGPQGKFLRTEKIVIQK